MGRIFWRTRKKKNGAESKSLYVSCYDPVKKYAWPVHIPSGNLKDARAKITELEGANLTGAEVIKPMARKILMSELFELLRSDYKRNSRKDLYSMEKRLDNHLIPYFKNFRAAAVTTEVVLKFTNEKLKTLKPATVNRMLSHISYAFRLALELGKVPKIPLIKRLEERNRRKGFFSHEEFQKVYVHLPAAVKPLAELGFFTGMRAGELLTLKWSQIDLKRSIIRLEETKSGNPRELHYVKNLEIKSLIDSQYERKLDLETRTGKKIENLFFRYSNGKPVLDFRVSWKAACKKAGIKRLFHDLRRSAIRNLTLAGVARETAKLISGHETDSVFERYNIQCGEDTAAALGKVSFENPSRTETVLDRKERVQ